MENPFESGHIKNYILFYASIVLIMILFFIASSVFHESRVVEKKVFTSEINSTIDEQMSFKEEDNKTSRFKLMKRVY